MPQPDEVSWSLEFRKVNFAYQQRQVEILKDLSFQVHQGEFLGHSAKSTNTKTGDGGEFNHFMERERCNNLTFSALSNIKSSILLGFNQMTKRFLRGILGTTGSGKSTILSLMLRLYEPTSGEILLDGKDIKEYNPLWLRRHIGFVSQDLQVELETSRLKLESPWCRRVGVTFGVIPC